MTTVNRPDRLRRYAFSLIAALLLIVATTTPRPAVAEDKAKAIFAAARALYLSNIKTQTYTYWVNGNIGDPDMAFRPSGLKIGDKLPAFTFADFYDPNQKLTIKELKPPFMLNFWASWCGPCRAEFKLFVESIKSQRLEVNLFLVNVGEYATNTRAAVFVESYGATLNTLTDPRSKFSRKVGIESIPTTLLIDADGKIQAMQVGGISEEGMTFLELIAANPGVGAFDSANPNVMPTKPKK